MNAHCKNHLKRIIPGSWIRWWRRRDAMFFTGPYDGWNAARNASNGYESLDILERVAAATRRVISGEVAYERDSVTFLDASADPCLIPELLNLLQSAPSSPLVVLDFGGSLGSSYHQNRRFLPATYPVRWHVIEQLHFAQLGAKEFQTEELRFHSNIATAVAEAGAPSLILLSSVLPYLDSPWNVLQQLALLHPAVMLVTRTPFSDGKLDRVVVQHVPRSIYRASYPSWIFSLARFEEFWAERQTSIQWYSTPENEMKTKTFRFVYRSAVIRFGRL